MVGILVSTYAKYMMKERSFKGGFACFNLVSTHFIYFPKHTIDVYNDFFSSRQKLVSIHISEL